MKKKLKILLCFVWFLIGVCVVSLAILNSPKVLQSFNTWFAIIFMAPVLIIGVVELVKSGD